jgi:hypothetical protein
MAKDKSEVSSKIETRPITVEELIRSQLQGKLRALHNYDAILWKIRSGYVIVLYGAITLFGANESKLPAIIGIDATTDTLFYLTVGVSLCALLIDFGFVLSKVRVVDARNKLSDHALKLATGKEVSRTEADRLQKLLHLSGEAATWPPWPLLANGTWVMLVLYSITPALLFILSRY